MISRKTVDFNSLIPNVSKSPLIINLDWSFWVCELQLLKYSPNCWIWGCGAVKPCDLAELSNIWGWKHLDWVYSFLYPYCSSYFALISTSTAYNSPNPAACTDWLYFSALNQFFSWTYSFTNPFPHYIVSRCDES